MSGGLLGEYIAKSTSSRHDGTTVEIDPKIAGKLPILVTHGKSDDQVAIADAKEKFKILQKLCGEQNKVEWREYQKGHQMISSKEEMQEFLKFLANNLTLRSVHLENRSDIVEVAGLEKLLEKQQL